MAQHDDSKERGFQVKNTATRKRPVKAPLADDKGLLIELSDLSAGRLVWEDGTVTAFNPQSKQGLELSASLRKVRKLPPKRVTVASLPVKRNWGWRCGRWTVISVSTLTK